MRSRWWCASTCRSIRRVPGRGGWWPCLASWAVLHTSVISRRWQAARGARWAALHCSFGSVRVDNAAATLGTCGWIFKENSWQLVLTLRFFWSRMERPAAPRKRRNSWRRKPREEVRTPHPHKNRDHLYWNSYFLKLLLQQHCICSFTLLSKLHLSFSSLVSIWNQRW